MRDIRDLLIVILCIAVLSFGSYFMYKILDPVDNEIIEKGKTYLRLYIGEDGKITSQENDHQILKIETPYEGSKLTSYVKDEFKDQLKYVLFDLKGLNIYDVKTKKIDQIINEKDYVDGDYYLHLDNKGEKILGYFFVGRDQSEEYYYSLTNYKKSFTDYKHKDKAFVGNAYGNYLVIGNNMSSSTCGTKMVIKSFDDNKELVSSKSIQVKLIGNKVYYEVRKDCTTTTFDLYNENIELIKKDIDNTKFSYAENGYYINEGNIIKKYSYDGKEISSTDYGEVLELHDNFALLRDSKSLYIMDLDTYEKVKVSDITESTEDINGATPQTVNGKHFMINHHDEIIIKLRIRNVTYSIKDKKVI